MKTHSLSAILTACAALLSAEGAPVAAKVTVAADRPGHRVSPTLWGVFFEDINLSADGGLYAELVRNRSFEDSDEPQHWSLANAPGAAATLRVTCEQPWAGNPLNTRNKRSLRVDVTTATPASPAGLSNGGYWGIPVRAGEAMNLALALRGANEGGLSLTASLESKEGKVYASAPIAAATADWAVRQAVLTPDTTDTDARLVLRAAAPGTVWLDLVTLFPAKTWKGRANGLRPDLAVMLEDLQPAFLRFPGGCWVEGDTLRESYRWKETIGPLQERRTQWNIWGYWATHGLGYHEYLQLCEDLKAEPLFCINVGMSHKENVPLDRMGEYVQDALDAIEYANGPASSFWGAQRARNGHPEPFGLKYLEIGNENGGKAYHERWPLFHAAIKARYPEIRLIANEWAGGHPKEPPADLVDEHYYNTPEFFMNMAGHYDSYDRSGPKIFVGEYAVTRNTGEGSLRGAIGEAAFMTGLERNSDIVAMAAYAPLFVHVKHRRWNPDLINFDNTRAFGLPSYFVQHLFAVHRGDVVLPTAVEAASSPIPLQGGAIGVGTWLTQAGDSGYPDAGMDEPVYQSDFSGGTKGWRFAGGGEMKVVDGALRQSGTGENVRAVFGDKDWAGGYTLSLKARKLGGDEGFLVMFNLRDDHDRNWWNLGGWGNTRHALEVGAGETGSAEGRIENNRWYDIRVETAGGRLKCFLDGRQIHDAAPPQMRSFFASATTDETRGEIILKVVNGAYEAQPADIRIEGARIPDGPAALAVVLTSAGAMDENSLDQPLKVAPRPFAVSVKEGVLRHDFPPNSFSIIRLNVAH
ncbi:MAG: alpha-L-arabinofuranosidase C-terminal domain-containing protein [Kiritimatiellia bacterium]